jgi:hypothetical protein
MKLRILSLHCVFDTGLAALFGTFATANKLAAPQGAASMPFDVRRAGVRRRICMAMAFTNTLAPARTVGRPDWWWCRR